MNTPKHPQPQFQPPVEETVLSTSLPTLRAEELKNVYCQYCAGTFDLSETGVFPEHFFNFRSLRKPCTASGTRYANVKGSPTRKRTTPARPTNAAKPAPKQKPKQKPKDQFPAPSLPTLRIEHSGKAQCPACDRMLSPNLKNNTLPVHKNNGTRCRMSNREFRFITKNGNAPKAQSSFVQHYTEKYKVRSQEDLQKEQRRKQRSAQSPKRDEVRGRRRRRSYSDSYALDCHDSWGRDGHSVDEGVSVRTYRGGLPGLGRRS